MPSVAAAVAVNDSLRAKVRSGLLWSAIQNWGVRLSGLLLFMVMARLLTPAELGLFSAAAVVLTFLNMLADQGLTEAVVQTEKVSQAQLNSVFWLNMGVSLTITLVLWFAAPWIAHWMNIPGLVDILRVSSLTIPIGAASFCQLALHKRAFQYRWLATATLASTLVGGAVAVALAFFGAGTWSLVAQLATASVLTTALLWLRSEWRLSRETDFRATRPLMNYGLHRLGAFTLDYASTRYIELFLAATLGPAVLAMYSVGVRVYQALMQALSSTVLDVAHNGFSRLAGDRPAFLAAYYKSMTVTAALAVPVFCMVAAMAPSLTVVLFGERWADSAHVMRFMCLLGAVQVLQFYNGTSFNAMGRPVINLVFVGVKAGMAFVALYLARDTGLRGLLAAYVVSQLLTTPISFFLVRRLVGVSLRQVVRRTWPFVTGCLLMIAACLGTSFGLQAWRAHALLQALAGCAAGGLVYLAFLKLAAPAALREAIAIVRPRTPPPTP